ncbi:MAG: 30S ribosomal protein S17 [Chloroflexi bacterium]|jgi:small subunit ribosomal protein S17|nr:30S ribosomal protein S17 [Chloroflexota bacterium]MBT3669349.1 30S ribosomal protein S17 [Chloroflexota bacterium]MBT4003452.1 30S ribosomal protein S17 [Chloroflexota bacterium]MBT4306056.1 30S ribosomal protein S17 [Chloroflexota bacterium]MBT4532700.1 30S ribosomal protein S17 [Chloroflexota bacterium]
MNTRRRITGTILSNKMQNTVTVQLTRKYRHPLYQKVITSKKSVKAHDELECQVGDEVMIVESRPISKTKRWVVQEILKRNVRAEVLAED